jgi:hypothetical protein
MLNACNIALDMMWSGHICDIFETCFDHRGELQVVDRQLRAAFAVVVVDNHHNMAQAHSSSKIFLPSKATSNFAGQTAKEQMTGGRARATQRRQAKGCRNGVERFLDDPHQAFIIG